MGRTIGLWPAASAAQASGSRDHEYCDRCRTDTERFAPLDCDYGHCKECHAETFYGYRSCYGGHCFWCKGHAGGNECNVCGD